MRRLILDRAEVLAAVGDPDLGDVVGTAVPALGPLDRDDAVAGDEILEAEVVDLGASRR